jgi:hypothetical protein
VQIYNPCPEFQRPPFRAALKTMDKQPTLAIADFRLPIFD